jgi:chromosomal replication initiator protein DnaA
VSEQLQLEDEAIPILLRRAWDRALRTLANRVNKPTFEAHIRTLRPVALTEAAADLPDDSGRSARPAGAPAPLEIILGVPSAFTREWVEKRHAPLIAGILEEILDRDVRLRFAILPKDPPAGAAAPRMPAGAPITPRSGTTAAPPEDAAGLFEAAGGNRRGANPLPAAGPAAAPSGATAGADRGRPGGTRPAVNGPASRRPPAAGAPAGSPAGSSGTGAGSPPLYERYTFDTFVVGQSNRLAFAGAQAVAQAPGRAYNPLFLYGPSGLGKTHLMHAIGNHLLAAEDGGKTSSAAGRVAYISGEAFTTHFITSLSERRGADDFRRKWRNVDVLLVDDIQFIAGKERTKEEFFHTFNALHQLGKQIVISSDRSPRELRAMDERLRSRFESGLIADIAPPDLETRLAILQKKAETERMRIPDDVLLYMARLVQSNIRTLEGALVKLVAYASLANSPVTTQLAADILERYFISAGASSPAPTAGVREPREVTDALPDDAQTDPPSSALGGNGSAGEAPATPPRRQPPAQFQGPTGSLFAESENGADAATTGAGAPVNPPATAATATAAAAAAITAAITAETVRRVVARRFNLEPDVLVGEKRGRDIAMARHIAMHLMRELTSESLPGIGQIFGGRGHSSVAHACDRIRNQIPFDDDLKRLVEDLIGQIEQETVAAT